MKLHENVIRGIYSYGFKKPSINHQKVLFQFFFLVLTLQKAIVPFAQGRDLLLQASYGTSRTTSYLIGILERLDFNKNTTQALVLASMREIAIQVAWIIEALGTYHHVTSFACTANWRNGE